MPLPAIIMAAARVLGPLLAEGGAMATGGRAAAGATTRGAAAAEGKASQSVLTKFDAALNKNPSMAGGGQSGGGNGGSRPPNNYQDTDPPSKWDTLKDFGGAMAKSGTRAVEQGRRLVQNDFMGMVQATDAIPEPVKKFIKALGDLTSAIIDRTEQLSGYNGSLANANAMRNVKLQLADIREANTVGPSYARVTNNATDLEVTIREIAAPFKILIADILGTVIKGIDVLAKLAPIQKAAESQAKTTGFLFDAFTGIPQLILEGLDKMQKDKELKDKGPEGLRMLNDLFKNVGVQLPQPQKAPMPNANIPMGLPILNG